MIGRLDEEGRALVSIRIGAAKNALVHEVDAWVDTGFNGDLVLPTVYIDALKLQHAGTAKAVFGVQRQIMCAAQNPGDYALMTNCVQLRASTTLAALGKISSEPR